MINPRSTSPSGGESSRVQQPAGQQQPATNQLQYSEGLRRKSRLLAAGLLAAARANPGFIIDLSMLAGDAAGMRGIRYPHRGSVSVQPLGTNRRPQGIELLVIDDNSRPGGHGDLTSYVANSHIDKTQNIETLLLENGVNRGLCEHLNELIDISKMQNPPEVISMSLGITPARKFEEAAHKIVLKYIVSHEGEDKSKWSPEGVKAYKTYLEQYATTELERYTSAMEMTCEDGTSYSQKRVNAFNALTNSGVTVVLCAGNDGRVEAMMNEAGLDVPEGLFSSLYYSNGEFLPDGVIVVGGSETLADGSLSAMEISNPNPAVDILAGARGVQVNAKGDTASGTSFSAPKVAALAANILAINPSLKPADVENIILSTATPLDDPKGRSRMGVVNATKALEAARESLRNKNS